MLIVHIKTIVGVKDDLDFALHPLLGILFINVGNIVMTDATKQRRTLEYIY